MKNLFEAATAAGIKQRVAMLTPESARQWGTMTPGQAMAHCAAVMEMAVGDTAPLRMFLGRIIGGAVKNRVLRDEQPLRRNTPTMPEVVQKGDRDLPAEQARLIGLIDRFSTGGAAGCTQRPHSFFGAMRPDEWAVLMYKHLDHHLRQFGV